MPRGHVFDRDVDWSIVQTGEGLEQSARELVDQSVFCWDTEGSGLSTWRGARSIGHSFAWRQASGRIKAVYFPIRHEGGRLGLSLFDDETNLDPEVVSEAIRPALEGSARKIAHNAKFDIHMGWADGIDARYPFVDTIIACKLIDENWRSYSLEACLATARIPHEKTWKATMAGEIARVAKQMREGTRAHLNAHGYEYASIRVTGRYACQDAAYELLLAEWAVPQVESQWPHIWAMECDLLWAIVAMERAGVPIDADRLRALSDQAIADQAHLAPQVWGAAGFEFDLGNDNEVRRALYDRLTFPVLQKTRNDLPQVNDDTLWKLELGIGVESQQQDLVRQVVAPLRQWKDFQKIKTTYTLGLIDLADDHGILHAQFDQGGARTGRMSCVAGWTPVRTRRGVVPMCQVAVGDFVRTHRERWGVVTRTMIKGVARMFGVRLSNGAVLTCTADHRFWTSEGLWVSVGDLIDERFKVVGGGQFESAEGIEALQVNGSADARDCRQVIDDVSQCAIRAENTHAGGRAESVGQASVFEIQDGIQKSDEGEIWGGSSQLDRGVLGSQRASNVFVQGPSSVCAPCCAAGASGVVGDPSGYGGAPYRWGRREQCPGQSIVGDIGGPSPYPLLAGPGGQFVEIEEINDSGHYKVYDITVAVDHSYEACGVFSHNSRNPNLQNIPVRTGLGREVRKAFVARPGMIRYCLDFSQVELRVLAHLTRDPLLLRVYREGLDAHATTAVEAFGTAGKVGGVDMRKIAKVLNFGTSFCMTEIGLMANVNKDLPEGVPWITEDKAREFQMQFYAKYASITQFRQRLWEYIEGSPGRYFENLLGRPRRMGAGFSPGAPGWQRRREERQSIASAVQGSAADLVKFAMVAVHKYLQSQDACEAQMVLMVHDDLQFDMRPEGSAQVIREIKRLMEAAGVEAYQRIRGRQFSVPMVVDVEYFAAPDGTWAEKHGMDLG